MQFVRCRYETWLTVSLSILSLAAFWCCPAVSLAIGPRITPSPHDDHHVVVVRPGELITDAALPAPTLEEPRATFSEQMAPITESLQSQTTIRHDGTYSVWIRVSQSLGKTTPVKVELHQAEKTLLSQTIHSDAGSLSQGGRAAYEAYRVQAKKNTPKGAVASLDSRKFEIAPDKTASSKSKPSSDGASFSDLTADLGDDLLEELKEKPADPWALLTRLEEQDDQQAAYWWKLGEVKLQAGIVRLHMEPAGRLPKELADAPRFDAALFTTKHDLTYPYNGDIDEDKATFVRFRLDKLPKAGLRLGAEFQTHVLQHPRLSVRFGTNVIDHDDPHTEPGYTCWYRLQDVKWMPAATKHEIGMRVNVNDAAAINIPAKDYQGATQFASFPHKDYVVREFDWSEPLGLNYTVALDVENYAHRLMTFRDHAREHYQTALSAAKRISPLTRGELYFTTICGSLDEHDKDYLLKTMRLLGFNSLSETGDANLGRKLFGWNRAHFSATMPMGDLFDEAAARKHYDVYFQNVFSTNQELWKDTWSYCYMDEPGELYREEMTGPYWQFVNEGDEPYWFDPVGDSALHIKRTELPDCVLEGVVERTSRIEFRVGLDDLQNPQQYYLWQIGYPLGPALNANLAYGKHVEGATVPSVGYRMVTSLGAAQGKLKFKIVYQQGSATLFINDRTIHQLVDLPKSPSFGIAGSPKKIYALRLRPLKPGEGVKLEGEADSGDEVAELGRAVLEELELDDLPDWARPQKLADFVPQECIYAGGVPGVAEAFRRWLKEQQLEPEFFGKQSWDEIRPLTLAELVRNEHEARLYYWSRRFSSQLTPRNFALISEAIHKHAPNQRMWSYAALSGGVIYRAKQMPLDMFHVGGLGQTATGGISDWMFYSTWRWDSHQTVAYSAELYNAGARRYGERPVSFPMMHCVAPTTFRAFTQLGAQVKLMSLYSYGPHYLNYPDSWAQNDGCYDAIARLTAKTAPADDILAPGLRRPSRVALLYPHSTEYWSTQDSFDDRRATFLALSHEYYQPEVITEQQIGAGALANYDALYVVDRHVAGAVQEKIGRWVEQGGLLWCAADSLSRDEYDQPRDLLKSLAGLNRTWPVEVEAEKKAKLVRSATAPKPLGPLVTSTATQPNFHAHTVLPEGIPSAIELPPSANVLAKYADGRPAWCEQAINKGRVVYVGHRAGATYTSKNIMVSGHRALWADTGREFLTTPLLNQKVARELVLSQPAIMASPVSSPVGTAIVLYNMRPSPRENLELRLREPVKPISVTHLVDGQLKAIPFEFADGMATIQLDKLGEEDIVYVRRKVDESDNRLQVIKSRTEEQLSQTDVESLSVGAWVAGFYPEWQLSDKLVPLVHHADWRVRRAAAESLGKLAQAPAGEALFAQAKQETDPHVLAEQLHSLALLAHPQLAELCQKYASDSRFVVRQAAVKALADSILLSPDTTVENPNAAELRAAARRVALAAIDDRDQRIRREAMRILARMEPTVSAIATWTAFSDNSPQAELDRPYWAQAVAAEDNAFRAIALEQKPFKLELALQMAPYRVDESLARVLTEEADKVTKEQAFLWSQGMIHQHDADSVRQLMRERGELPERVQYYLPLVLENMFEAGYGNVLEDWENYLEK